MEKVRSVYTCPSLLVIKRSQFWNPWATTSMADIPQCSGNKVAPSYLKLKRETPREWRKKRCSFTTLDRLYDPSDDSVLTSSISFHCCFVLQICLPRQWSKMMSMRWVVADQRCHPALWLIVFTLHSFPFSLSKQHNRQRGTQELVLCAPTFSRSSAMTAMELGIAFAAAPAGLELLGWSSLQ